MSPWGLRIIFSSVVLLLLSELVEERISKVMHFQPPENLAACCGQMFMFLEEVDMLDVV